MTLPRPTFEELRALAHPNGRPKAGANTVPVADLLAISPPHDPFYVGQAYRMAEAQWFAAVWSDYGKPGDHLRRIHYRVIHQRERTLLMPDGTPYVNSEACWSFLEHASRNARYARLVRADAFTDQRNPDPEIFSSERFFESEPEVDSEELDTLRWLLPAIPTWIGADLDAIPTPGVTGYDYDPHDQPYLLEVWIEKSTMEDILVPLCRRYHMNLITGVGRLSITRVVEMLYRVARDGRPARIFYISDHDPAGDGMPVQVARHTEFFMGDYAPDADVKLQHLALTPTQVGVWDLPRKPIKDSDRARGNFEARYGSGAVELDALEAIVPGALARLVEDAIEPYRDRQLPRRLDEAQDEADAIVAEQWQAAIAGEQAELEAIAAAADAIARPYQEELQRLDARLSKEIAPLRDRLELVRQAVRLRLAEFQPELPERPAAETEPVDESLWLFDSARSYWEQLRFYKGRHNGTSTEEEPG